MKSIVVAAFACILCFAAQLGLAQDSVSAKAVTETNEPIHLRANWHDAGYSTPQNTAMTFAWALREKKTDKFLKCYDKPLHNGEAGFEAEDMKYLSDSLLSVQPLAYRIIDDRTVDLKSTWRVKGLEKEQTFSHRMTFVDGMWKFMTSENSQEVDW